MARRASQSLTRRAVAKALASSCVGRLSQPATPVRDSQPRLCAKLHPLHRDNLISQTGLCMNRIRAWLVLTIAWLLLTIAGPYAFRRS